MDRKSSEAFASRVIHYYKNRANCNKKSTADHFVAEGKNRNVIYTIITRFELTGETKYKNVPGRRAVKSIPKNTAKVKSAF